MNNKNDPRLIYYGNNTIYSNVKQICWMSKFKCELEITKQKHIGKH